VYHIVAARDAKRLEFSASALVTMGAIVKRLTGVIIFWSAQPTGDHIFTDSKRNKADENKLLSTTRDFTHEHL